MSRDMREQPDALRALLRTRGSIHATVRRIAPVPFRAIALVGRGSSANAGLYGRLLLDLEVGIPVTLEPPTMAALYEPTADAHGILVIGLSQSGRTEEIAESLRSFRRRGAATIGVTAQMQSALVDACDAALDIATGDERAVPATKTFLSEIAVMAMIAEALGDHPWPEPAWDRAIAAVESALADEHPAVEAARRIAGAHHVSVIGAGLFVGLAEEAALKIAEAARLPASGYSSEAFRHGPMTVAGPTDPVVTLSLHAKHDALIARALASLQRTPVVQIADRPDAEVPFESGIPEALAAFPATVRAQQLALHLALARGVDPDRPPRLRKVAPS